MGNSEVGHLNLGAGAVVHAGPDADRRGRRGRRAGRQRGPARARCARRERVHLIGLVSDGGVHSGLEHLRALIALAAELDGARPRRARLHRRPRHAAHVRRGLPASTVEGWMRRAGAGRVGSVVGRYYAMDRDQRWDRVQRAYDLLVHGRAEHRADSGAEAAARPPTSATRPTSSSRRRWSARRRGSAPATRCWRFNFRPDRMREITRALAEPGFDEVDRGGADAGRALRDDDRVRGGLAVPGRVPARAPGDDAPGGDRRRAASASCTSPRPRSTRT